MSFVGGRAFRGAPFAGEGLRFGLLFEDLAVAGALQSLRLLAAGDSFTLTNKDSKAQTEAERSRLAAGEKDCRSSSRLVNAMSITSAPISLEEANDGRQGNEDETKGKEENDNSASLPFYKLFGFADSLDLALMVVGTTGAIGNGMAMPLMTLLLGEAINTFGQNQSGHHLVPLIAKISLKFVYLASMAGASAFLQVACWMTTGERQAARIRGLYLRTILTQDISYFDKETNTGEVAGRISGDTVLIQDAMGEKVGKFLQLATTFVGGFVIAFFKGWLLTLVLLTSIPPLVACGAVLSMFTAKAAIKGQSAYARAANVAEQTISSIRMVASFTGEKLAIAKYDKFLVDAYKSGVQEGMATGLSAGFMWLIIFSTYGLATWFGGKMILEKGYTGGEVLNVIIAILTGSVSLGQASPCMSAFAAGQAAAANMFETINRNPQINLDDPTGMKLHDIRGTIELKDICFSYPVRLDERIFDGLSLHIPHGTSAALVGQSGSGKSTVISLIERFYDPQAGEVLIDGVNLKDFNLKWIRSKIGLVSQEPMLFTASIKDNIMYGKEGATTGEIRMAVELANAANFIDKLPQGIETMVGEHGTQLSGGQKQRIAIARAILKDPKILLLDEATSALDVESERVVQEALDQMMGSRTTVIVAHRLSTVRSADMIAVIHQGKIVEKGKHLELLSNPEGAYSQLVHLQEVKQESGRVAEALDLPDGLSVSRNSSFRGPSLLRTVSRVSSGAGKGSCRSFSVSSRVHEVGPDIGNNSQEGQIPASDRGEEKLKPMEVSISRIARLNKPEIPVILAGTIFAVISGTILPIYGLLLARVINTFYEVPEKLRKDSEFWAAIFVALGLVSCLSSSAQTYFFYVAGCKLIQRVRSLCFTKVVHMEVGWFDEPEHSSGVIGAKLSVDATALRGLVGDAVSHNVQNTACGVVGLVIAFASSWQLAFIILAMFPLLFLSGYAQMKFMKGYSADAKMMYEEASQVATDAVGNIRTVASFSAEEKIIRLYAKKCEDPMKAGIVQGLVCGLGFGISLFLLYCVYGTCFYVGAWFVQDGKTTFMDVFRVLLALTLASIGITESSSLSPDSSKAKTAAASVFGILDQKSNIDPTDESGTMLENVVGEIVLHNVTFNYPSRPDVLIFRDLSLTIQAGKTIALVGESGSGKSTVIALLQRFYDPDSGYISLDGVDIKSLRLKWYRQLMGLVSQEPILFNDTVRANIAYGKEGDALETEILAASKLANAHNFISSLDQSYDTFVGERGAQLSGGQKQRVAIARAIMRDPRILLLDEATSALDAESERAVQDALDKVMVNRTTVVVAHRLSTIKNADVIEVVKDGKIIEKGNHDKLIGIEGGVYAALVALHRDAAAPQ